MRVALPPAAKNLSTRTIEANAEMEKLKRQISQLIPTKSKINIAPPPDESPRTMQAREQLEQVRMEKEKLEASRLASSSPALSSRTYQNLNRSDENVQAEPRDLGNPAVTSAPTNDLNASRTGQLPLPAPPSGMSSRTVQIMDELNALKQANENLKSGRSMPPLFPRTSTSGLSSPSSHHRRGSDSLNQENGKPSVNEGAPSSAGMSSGTVQGLGDQSPRSSPRTVQALGELNTVKQEYEKLVASRPTPSLSLPPFCRNPFDDDSGNERLNASGAVAAAPGLSSQSRYQMNNNRAPADTMNKAVPTGPSTSLRTLQVLDELAKVKKEVELLKASNVELPPVSDRTRQVMDQLEKVKRENALLKSSKVEALATAQRRLAYLEQNHASASRARIQEIKKMVVTSQELDIAFLVDATGSMQSSIDMIKDTVTTMASGIMEAYPECKLRVAFAPYRDYDDTAQDDADACDFTTSFTGPDSVFAKALSRVHAFGGGDDAEDVFTGIARVASLSWDATNRLLFHIADAPCHGLQFHDGVGDHYPTGDKYGRTIESQLQLLDEICQISTYFFCHVNSSTRKMLQVFKGAAPRSIQILEEQFENISTIPYKVVTLCRGTIQKTLSVVAAAHPVDLKYVNEVLVKAAPSWLEIPPQTGTHFRYKWYRALDDLLSKINSKMALNEVALDQVQIKIAKHPFSEEGSVRWPYYAMITPESGPPQSMVVKRFKTPLGKDVREVHKRDRYLAQMEVQSVAAHMAIEFNNRTSNFKNVKKVEFTEVTTLEVGSGPTTKFYNMESLLEGEWIRYNNNGGYVNTSDYAAVLQAFTHWTHERSRGLLMVTDLQGVRMTNAYGERHVFCLCDPAIHCTDVMRFTRTNLGAEGFKLFFDTHKCNDVCKNLGLKVGTAGRTISGTMVGSYW